MCVCVYTHIHTYIVICSLVPLLPFGLLLRSVHISVVSTASLLLSHQHRDLCRVYNGGYYS